MTIPEKAVQNALAIANDESHGYDQTSRWGPDYDCSSLVITAYKNAGLPLTCTYTGNMRADMFNNGFAVAPVNLTTGEGLRPGDVLLNEKHHTALYIGYRQIVHARGNERGGATGGKTGDQTGKEICTQAYFNFPWDYALRFVSDRPVESPTVPSTPQTSYNPTPSSNYTVQRGDSLWGISERAYGNGSAYPLIVSANHLTGSIIYPGQILYIPKIGGEKEPETTNTQDKTTCTATLPVLKRGVVSMSVKALQSVLSMRGYMLDIDGDFGKATETIVKGFQTSIGLDVTGVVDGATWEKLIN